MRVLTEFFAPGVPKPGGSKKAFLHPHTGRIIVTEDSNNKPWRNTVATFALQAYPDKPVSVPLALDVTFYMPRPKHHSGVKGIKPGAPRWPTTKPDATKLIRALEDALTGILWVDDALIVGQVARKLYAEDGRVGARVIVFELEDRDRGPEQLTMATLFEERANA